jgi:tRNA(Arg) A34 adenosine deaminase TadA
MLRSSSPSRLTVLVADDDDAERERLAQVLEMSGFTVIQAIHGSSAVKVLEEWNVDVAVIDHHMSPQDGFYVARHIMAEGLKVGVILMTDNSNTDTLLEAGKYRISQVLQKPADTERLIGVIRRVLRAFGKSADALSSAMERLYSPQELMQRCIALAMQNARSKMGGPFGAVVADPEGRILGEGVNGVTTRCDPTAHAEVLAIRRATEKLGKPRLDGCTVYCSSEPTMLGQALIIGTGVGKVYYGLSHSEVGATRVNEEGILGEMAKPAAQRSVRYEQLLHDEAQAIFDEWKAEAGVSD